jgi:hypothetical protein
MPNAKNLRTPTSEEARAMQKKSAAKRSQNIKEKKLIREILEERLGNKDLEEICDNLIIRAKGDSKDFEVLQAAIGQKPVDKVMLAEVDQETINEVEKMVLGEDDAIEKAGG